MKNRVWVYLSDKPFSPDVETALAADVASFLEDWNAHGTALSSSFALSHHQFIIIQADEEKFSASGCSIDKQLRFIKESEQKYGLSLLNRLIVAYRAGNEIKTVHSSRIPALLAAGGMNENTLVYNVGVGNDSELKDNFEIPLKQSWLAKFLSPVK
jgi:hypothetical protein